MSRDNYRDAAAGWAQGATLVYAPIAAHLVARSPISFSGARVLDVGAGTGASEAPLRSADAATIVEVDLSPEMLVWNRADRPPAIVADVMLLPFPNRSFGAAVASFVLNHLTDPVGGLSEIARVVQLGGALLASVYANSSHSESRDAVDAIARAHGWSPPEWYVNLKANAAPLLGTVDQMKAAATAAGLAHIHVDEDQVDVGIEEPGMLVDYRFGQAQFAEWRARLSPHMRAGVRSEAIATIADVMEPYRPRVVFLNARNGP